MSEVRLIDANALKKALAKNLTIWAFNTSYDGVLAKVIDNAPTIEERPQGEWIEKEETPASVSYYCSNCECVGLGVEHFCSWCGAEMKIKQISQDSGIREFDKKFADLLVFKDQPQRQLESSDVHEDVSGSRS